jgi:hypothetical protein
MMVFRTTLAAAVALLLVGLASPASAAVILESLSAGPFGAAQVDGFAADNKQAYRYNPGTFTDTVSGISGDENDSAFYTATMTYSVPATGSLLSASGDWSFGTNLSTQNSNSVGAGLLFDTYLSINAGQTFTITGQMKNAGILFRDPDGMDVFPFTSNYFSGSTDPFSFSGTLTKTGRYHLQMISSMVTSGSPGNDAGARGGFDLMMSVDPAAVPEPSSLLILSLLGAFAFGARPLSRARRGVSVP